MTPFRFGLPVLAVLLAAGCTSVRPPGPGAPSAPSLPSAPAASPPSAPSLGFFSRIKVPNGHEPVLRLRGNGVQIFRCEAVDGEHLWRFRQPEADLIDDAGQVAARHGANFTFEHRDTSRLVTAIVAHDDAPKRDDLRWVLFTARPYGRGVFGNISYVQRVNTTGGMPPPNCQSAEAGRLLRVNFSAEFVFYRARS